MVSRAISGIEIIGVRAVFYDLKRFILDRNIYNNNVRQMIAANNELTRSTIPTATQQLRLNTVMAASSKAARLSITEKTQLAQAARAYSNALQEVIGAEQRQLKSQANLLKPKDPITGRYLPRTPENLAAAKREALAADRDLERLNNKFIVQKQALINLEERLSARIRQRIATAKDTKDLVSEQQRIVLLEKQERAQRKLAAAEAEVAAARASKIKAGAFAVAVIGAAVVGGTTAATVSAAAKYQDSLTKIDNLTNLTSEDTAKFGKRILELSRVIPLSPDDLGVASYEILSRGFSNAAEAEEILVASAKSAVAGFGDVKQIAIAITGIINAYGKENITAAQAADVLFATVKVGGGEFNNYANDIGRVTQIARTLGVTFDQVGAAVAVLTNVGIPASQATTALLGILNQIASPSKEAEDALIDAGTSIQQLRINIRDKGLLPALQEILVLFGNNVNILETLFPEVRGYSGALALLAGDAKKFTEAQGNINNSLGIVNDAFENTKDNFNATAQILKSQLIGALIQLGAAILPGLTKAVGDLNKFLDENQKAINDTATFIGSNLIPAMSSLAEAILQPIAALIDLISLLQTLSSANLKNIIEGKIDPKSLGDTALSFVKHASSIFNPGGFIGSKIAGAFLADDENPTEEVEKIGEAAKNTKIELKKIPPAFNDVAGASKDSAKKAKEAADMIKDGIITLEEAIELGFDAATSGAIEGVHFLKEETKRTNEEVFNLAKTLAKVALVARDSTDAANRLVQSLAQGALEAARTALSALTGRPTQEEASLNLKGSKLNLSKIFLDQLIEPQLEALEKQMDAIKDISETQIDAIEAQIEAIKITADSQKRALERQIQSLEDGFDRTLRSLDDALETIDDQARKFDRDSDDSLDSLRDTLDNIRDIELKPRKDILDPKARDADLKKQQKQREKQIKAAEDAIEAFENETKQRKRAMEDQKEALDDQKTTVGRAQDDQVEALKRQMEAFDESTDAQVDALERQKDALERSSDAQDKELEKRRDLLQAQLDDHEKQSKAIEDQISVYKANRDIIERQIDIADKSLLTEEELRLKMIEVKDQVGFSSVAFRDLTLKTKQDLIPEMDLARVAFNTLKQSLDVLNDPTLVNVISKEQAAALHAQILAEAEGNAAGGANNLAGAANNAANQVKLAGDVLYAAAKGTFDGVDGLFRIAKASAIASGFGSVWEATMTGLQWPGVTPGNQLATAMGNSSAPGGSGSNTIPGFTPGFQHGGFVNQPMLSMLGEGFRKELVLPLTNEARTRELIGSLPAGYRNRVMGNSSSMQVNLYNPSFPNVTNGRQLLSELETLQADKLRDSYRGIARGVAR